MIPDMAFGKWALVFCRRLWSAWTCPRFAVVRACPRGGSSGKTLPREQVPGHHKAESSLRTPKRHAPNHPASKRTFHPHCDIRVDLGESPKSAPGSGALPRPPLIGVSRPGWFSDSDPRASHRGWLSEWGRLRGFARWSARR